MLLLLDLHTLLLAKRVCIKFRDVIENSSRIQKVLFMPPLASPTVAEMEVMKTWSADDYWNDPDRYYAKPLPKGSSRVVALDPFLTRYLRQRFRYKRGQWRRSRSIYLPTFPSDVVQKPHGSPASASWRRMLIFQPHTAPMEVITNFDYTKNPVFEKTSQQHGLSMGALVDYEVRAHKLLNGKTLTEDMKLTNCGYYYDAVQIMGRLILTLGEEDVHGEPWFECSKSAKDICRLGVLAPAFGKEVDASRPY